MKKYSTPGIPDNEFIRGAIPMTKEEVRAVTLSKLSLYKGAKVLDIGAGTGSVSVECALLGALVTAVEKKEEGQELILQNCRHFGVEGVEVLKGEAPEILPEDELFDRVFIGGSGGALTGIFDYLHNHLAEGGVLVANTVTLENSYLIISLMEEKGYCEVQAVTVNISRSCKIADVHMMKAENPVTVIRGIKGKICQK